MEVRGSSGFRQRKPSETLVSHHYLIPGSFFTSEQWHGPLASHVERLVARPGGILLVSVEVAPNRRNYPSVSFGVFDANERKALRVALERCRVKRQKIKRTGQG
jgi:hypothetical protein